MADESRYVARSALISPETLQYLRRPLHPARELEGLGKIAHVSTAQFEIARGPEPIERILIAQGTEKRYGTPSVRDLERLTALNTAKQLARPLP